MKEATLIFPHQLYNPHPASAKDRLHIMAEDTQFFEDPATSIKFHKQKLMLHRASMKCYEKEVLRKQGFKTIYVDLGDISAIYSITDKLKKEGLVTLHVVDPNDQRLEQRLKQFCELYDLDLMIYETPNFLTPKVELERFFSGRRRPRMEDFYINQRKRMGILLDGSEEPLGGKWIVDSQGGGLSSRRLRVPEMKRFRSNAYVEEARHYVEKKFPDHPGVTGEFVYPISEEEAKAWFDDFLERRFDRFGSSRELIARSEPFLFNSVLSSSLNIGLISPTYVLERLNRFLKKRAAPIEAVEPFVRQIIGWREFMRGVYLTMGVKQSGINFFLHAKRLSSMWYGVESGLPPLDDVLRGMQRYAYCSGAERLKVLGNLMLICEVHPDEVHRWFMEMFVDAYDWSMVPNVYGLSQFADGGLIIPAPHVYPSSEITSDSDYGKGEWCRTWDGLLLRFMERHRLLFSRNPQLIKHMQFRSKFTKRQRKELIKLGDRFIRKATR